MRVGRDGKVFPCPLHECPNCRDLSLIHPLLWNSRLIEGFSHGGETADAVAQRLLWDMRRYAGLTARTDDVTLIVAKIL